MTRSESLQECLASYSFEHLVLVCKYQVPTPKSRVLTHCLARQKGLNLGLKENISFLLKTPGRLHALQESRGLLFAVCPQSVSV